MAVLQRGGNAVDAAIATAAALNVVEPNMSGVGGDGFIMIYNQQAGSIEVCNGTGAAPYATDVDWYRKNGIPTKGILSVSVPGLVDAWMATHAKYGTLSRAEVFDAAIDLSENGFPVTHVLAGVIGGDRMIQEFPDSQAIFAPGGAALRPGQILRQPGLADTFKAIVDGGRDAFYEGETARAIVKFSEEQGGLLSLKDLADCRSRWEAPISTSYHGHTVYEAPPNSSGHVLLQELNIVEQFDLKSLGCNTQESIHLMVEAKKLAFADREAYMADPDWVAVPVAGMLSKQYAAERARLIDPERAAEAVGHGDPWSYQPANYSRRHKAASAGAMQEEDTTCFVVVDRWGNAVCQFAEHPEFAGVQYRGRRHRHPAQQPDDLLASRPGSRGLSAAGQAGATHDESDHGVPQRRGIPSRYSERGLTQRRIRPRQPGAGVRHSRRRHAGADEHAGHHARAGLRHDRGRGGGGPPLAQHPQSDGVQHTARVRQPAVRRVAVPHRDTGTG